jgi:hypothetical protein
MLRNHGLAIGDEAGRTEMDSWVAKRRAQTVYSNVSHAHLE